MYLTFGHWGVQAALDISNIRPLKVDISKYVWPINLVSKWLYGFAAKIIFHFCTREYIKYTECPTRKGQYSGRS